MVLLLLARVDVQSKAYSMRILASISMNTMHGACVVSGTHKSHFIPK